MYMLLCLVLCVPLGSIVVSLASFLEMIASISALKVCVINKNMFCILDTVICLVCLF